MVGLVTPTFPLECYPVNAEESLQFLVSTLEQVEPMARLVSARVVRRLIIAIRDVPGLLLTVPHGWGFAVSTKAALEYASPQELGLTDDLENPSRLLLLAQPSARLLAEFEESTAIDWLLPKLVHLAVDNRLGGLGDSWCLAGVGEVAREEVFGVLVEEDRLLPGTTSAECLPDFLATAMELEETDREGMGIWFPSVDAIELRQYFAGLPELDQARVLATRLKDIRAGLSGETTPYSQHASTNPESRELAVALFPGETVQQEKLSAALAQVFFLVEQKGQMGQPGARALLAGLRQVVQLVGVTLEKVDAFAWLSTWGETPLRRELPYSGLLIAIRSMRLARGKVIGLGLGKQVTGELLDLLGTWLESSEECLLDRVRPGIEAAFRAVGLVPERALERLAWRQVIDELLDRVARRGEISLGDLRDALAGHRLKLADLCGPWEWLRGDLLLRADREMSRRLPGVYRRGEIYMRGLQRLSSLFYGNLIGRTLFLYILFPLCLVYVAVKGLQELANIGLFFSGKKDGLLQMLNEPLQQQPWLPVQVEGAELVLGNQLTYLTAGFFVSLLIFSPFLREAVARLTWRIGVLLHRLFLDLPFQLLQGFWWLTRIPVLKPIYQHGVRPSVEALLVMVALDLSGWLPVAGDGRRLAFFVLLVGFFLLPYWRRFEEALVEMAGWVWNHLGLNLLLAILEWIMATFRLQMERISSWLRGLERVLLRPATARGRGLPARAFASILISPLVYVVRAVLLVFVEPQVNPVKHFPVVTVGHKLMLTLAPGIASSIAASTGKKYIEVLPTVIIVLTLVPGIMGFLAWELKENWRLYKANQAKFLRPVVVGSHGENMRGMLAPGFHSGTLPRLFRRLRRADPIRRIGVMDQFHQAKLEIQRLLENEFLELLRQCPVFPAIRLGGLRLSPRQIQAQLAVDGYPGFCLVLAWRGWWMEAVLGPVPIEGERAAILDDLVDGFWHKSGADIARSDWKKALPGLIRLEAGSDLVCVHTSDGNSSDYPLDDSGPLKPSRAGWPALDRVQMLVSARPILWAEWDSRWEGRATEDLGGA